MKNPIMLTSKKIMTILVCALLSFCLIYTVSAQSSSSTVVKAEASTNQLHVGDTLTVNIKISNVQNLAGIDVTLEWNSSVLTFSNVNLSLGVESYPNGVLHGNKLNYDFNSVNTGDIYVEEEKVLGSYHLVAQSIGQTTASFSGSGTIATVKFNVTNIGDTGLNLQSELADHPASGQSANLIEHTDTATAVDVAIPEFQSLTILVLFMVLATATLAIGKKQIKKNKPNFS